MPVNRKRLLELLKEQLYTVEERCEGYHEELLKTIADILLLEYNHRIQGTRIKQKVYDKCSALATLLSKNQNLE